MPSALRVFLAAGEVSGDARAAELILALQDRVPALQVHAIAGQRVAATGATVVRDLDAWHSVRVKELRARRARWAALRADLPDMLRTCAPDLIVLVQNPQLNRVVARAAKAVCPDVPLVWFMPPEIWAWDFPAWLGALRPGMEPRVNIVRDTCDAVITVHPFERDAYLNHLPTERVHLVPHPAVDYVTSAVPDTAAARRAVRGELGIAGTTRLIGLFPGSRQDEVRSLYGLMLAAARGLGTKDYAYISAAASPALRDDMQSMDTAGLCRVVEKRPFLEVLAACDLALLASGTSTLDAAVLGIPHVVLYRLDVATYVLARWLGRVDWYGLPNIIAGREICPERRNFRATPGRVLKSVRHMLNGDALTRCRADLADVRTALRGPGGIAQAADILLQYAPVDGEATQQ